MPPRAKSSRNTDTVKHYAPIIVLVKSLLFAVYMTVSEYYSIKSSSEKVPELEKELIKVKSDIDQVKTSVQSAVDKCAISEKLHERRCLQNTKRIDIIFEESYKAHIHSSGEGNP